MALAPSSLDHPFAGRSPFDAGVDRVWRFFCSVRAAIWEMVFLTVLVLIGTLRGSSFPRWLADHLPALSGLVDRWYAWDVFASLPFMGILTLLAVAITICTANRAPGIWASIAHPTISTTHSFLRNAETSARFSAAAGETRDAFSARVAAALASSRYRVLTSERGAETHLYADRSRWGKLGTFPFHLALILVLVGGIVGARWGFRETEFIVPEGVTRAVGHDTGLSIRVDDFSEQYRETGMALEYRSDLTVLRGDEPVKSGSITVNHPLTYQNLVVYQAGFGQAVRLQVADTSGNAVLDEIVALGPFQAEDNPDAPAGQLDILPARARLNVIAPDTNPRNAPERDQLNLRPGQMYLQLQPLTGNADLNGPVESVIDQGETVALGGLNVTFVREKRFTVLQVGSNPGIPIFVAAGFMLVGGLAVTFYFPHRRVRGIVRVGGDGRAAVHLAPLARRDWSARRAFDDLTNALERTLGVSAERIVRDSDPTPEPRPTASPASAAAAPAAD
jgi:cytochrome c biogenesis protein